MAANQQHIIHHLDFEWNAQTQSRSAAEQDMRVQRIKDNLIARIEKVLDQLDDGSVVRIDQLTITLDQLDSKQLESEIIHQITRQLPEKIKQAIKQNQVTPSEQSPLQIMIFFLEHGTLPWYAQQLSFDALEQAVADVFRSEPQRVEGLCSQLTSIALDRMIKQCSDTFFSDLLRSQKIATPFLAYLQQLRQVLSLSFSTRKVRNQIWRSTIDQLFFQPGVKKHLEERIGMEVLQLLSISISSSPAQIIQSSIEKNDPEPSVLNFLQKLSRQLADQTAPKDNKLNEDTNPATLSTSVNKEPPVSENTNGVYFIENAGLVLLHPFFVYLFEQLEYTKDNQFVDPFQQQQAALLLQYLLTERSDTPEFILPLNKLLCGIPLQQPTERQLILNEEIKHQSQQLLEATIKHWSAVKNTTPDGLRNAFLLRPGKLQQKLNGDWQLFVQQKTEDILLTKLPWSFSMIKLPWMTSLLWVEWA